MVMNTTFAIDPAEGFSLGRSWQRQLPDAGVCYAEIQVILICYAFPHPSRYSLDTFSRLGEGFYSRAFFSCKTALWHDRN